RQTRPATVGDELVPEPRGQRAGFARSASDGLTAGGTRPDAGAEAPDDRRRGARPGAHRARALVAPGIRALLDHPQPVAVVPGEADSLRSRFRDRWARIPERQLRPATVSDEL